MFAVDVGGLNKVPYARAFNETDTRITLNQRVRAVRRESAALGGRDRQRPVAHRTSRLVDCVVVDHGTAQRRAVLRAQGGSGNGGEVDYAALMAGRPQHSCATRGAYQLFRIGDAVSGRNIHAAVYDALRL